MTKNDSSGELRLRALAAEQEATEVIALPTIWTDLTEGRARIVDDFFTEDRCFIVLNPVGARAPVLPPRRQRLLEELLRGHHTKQVAADLNLSISTVSQDAKLALRQLGLDRTVGYVHPMLAMSVQAANDGERTESGRTGLFAFGDRTLRVVGCARPEGHLARILSPAEFAVVRGVIEGKNYVEIATHRGTSTRTVANQLAAAFRRLGVSGKADLLHRVVSSASACLVNEAARYSQPNP
jgi:DNA-binding NarL/FixJ family response regulator